MKYELKKLLRSKLVIICVCILILCRGFFVYNAAKGRLLISEDAYDDLLESVENMELSDAEKLDWINKKVEKLQEALFLAGNNIADTTGEFGGTVLDDLLLYSRAQKLIKLLFSDFSAGRRTIITDAIYNIRDEKKKTEPDQAVIAVNEIVIRKYNRYINMKVKEPGSLLQTLEYSDFTVWDYALIAFVIILTVRMYSMDETCGAGSIVYTSVLKRKILYIKEYLSVYLIVVAALIIDTIIQIVCGHVFFRVRDLSLPIQMEAGFEFCPFLISFGGYFVIRLLCRLLLMACLLAFTAFVSIVGRKASRTLPVCFAAGIGLLVYYVYVCNMQSGNMNALNPGFKVYEKLRIFLPHSLLNLKPYFDRFDYTGLGTLLLPRILWCVLITAVVTAAFFLAGMHMFGRKRNK